MSPSFIFKTKKDYLNTLHRSFLDPTKLLQSKSPVVIYGAGRMGKMFLHTLRKHEIPVEAFIDTNQKLVGTSVDALSIISIEEAKQKYLHTPILIASLLYENEIYTILKHQRFTKIYPLYILNLHYPDLFVSPEYTNYFHSLFSKRTQQHIEEVFSLLGDKQSKRIFRNLIKFRLTGNKLYIQKSHTKHPMFDVPDIFTFTTKETFVDCGGYTGDSIEAFTTRVAGKYEAIYSFEPDPRNYIQLRQFITNQNIEKIITIKKGVYDKTGWINFSSTGNVDSRITNSTSFIPKSFSKSTLTSPPSIKIIELDNYFSTKPFPTFIKMDIEGVEKNALLGAKKLLRNAKPKLAISIYHHAHDLWELPLLIRRINPEYRLYIRHYSEEIVDTLCYAV